jgi:hypothetical protein
VLLSRRPLGALLIFVLAAIRLSAADPRLGTWTRISSHAVLDPAPQITLEKQDNGIRFTRINAMSNVGAQERWSAKFDGQDYPVTGMASSDSVSLIRVDASTIEFTRKHSGKVVGAGRLRASSDGKEMSMMAAEGEPTGVTLVLDQSGGVVPELSRMAVRAPGLTLVWDRKGGDVDPANPLLGVWIRNEDKTDAGTNTPAQPIKFEANGPNGVTFVGSFSYTAQFDGRDYPLLKSRGDTVSLSAIDARTVEESYRKWGRLTDVVRMVVSADGKTMRVNDRKVLAGGQVYLAHTTFRKQ